MAKAKRERRTSFRTMEAGNATDFLDRIAAIENTQPVAVVGPEDDDPSSEPNQGVQEGDTDAGGDL